MIAKINDTNITSDDVNHMSVQEYKNFENRLRSKAKREGFRLSKDNSYSYTGYYIIDIKNNVVVSSNLPLTIIEVRDWLYDEIETVSDELVEDSEKDTVTAEMLKRLFEIAAVEADYGKLRNDHVLLKCVLEHIEITKDKASEQSVEGSKAKKRINNLINSFNKLTADIEHFLKTSNKKDKPQIEIIPFIEDIKK